jgi:hypothetical protein
MTVPMVSVSTPRSSTPAVFEALEAIDSPPATAVTALTPGTSRRSSARSRQLVKPPTFLVSTRTWALLPKILRFRSAPKPPMIETTTHKASALTATPKMDSTEITVKKPLFVARTWRALTNITKPPRSNRSSTNGMASDKKPTTKPPPESTVPSRTPWCQSTKAVPRVFGSCTVQKARPTKAIKHRAVKPRSSQRHSCGPSRRDSQRRARNSRPSRRIATAPTTAMRP